MPAQPPRTNDDESKIQAWVEELGTLVAEGADAIVVARLFTRIRTEGA
jgi:hypothetical protein